MDRRSKFGTATTTVLLAAVVGAMTATPVSAGGVPPVQVRWPGGVMVISPDQQSRVLLDAPEGLATHSGSSVVKTVRSATTTTVRVVDGDTGAIEWSADVAGAWRAEAISPDADTVLLGDPASAPTIEHVPLGRETTPLTVVRRDGRVSALSLPGNFQGEAFTADGQVVLIEHRPANAPTEYRVRLFDPKLNRIADPIGKDKKALPIEAMRGVRHGHAWSADAKALYTLYDASTPELPRTVFVHALNLRAYDTAGRDPNKDLLSKCLLIPEQIDSGGGFGAVAVLPDNNVVVVGRRGIAVIDATSGALLRQRLGAFSGRLSVAVTGAEVVVASGKTVRRFSHALQLLSTFPMASEIVALSAMPYYPMLVLDVTGRLWLAASADLANRPVLRGQLPRSVTGRVTMFARTV